MRIHLAVDYISDYVFWPIFRLDGTLLAVEMISHFNGLSGKLSMPADILLTQLNSSQKHDFVHEQLLFIKEKSAWFIDNHVQLVLKVGREITEILIKSDVLRGEIKRLDFVLLEINEFFPQLSQGKENAALLNLSQSFPLWLDNFGSGKTTLKPLHDGLVRGVKLDRQFIGQLLSRPANTLMIEPLLRTIKNSYSGISIVAKEINNMAILNKIGQLNIDAVQGQMWPAVHFDGLKQRMAPLG
ncbi:EAL domain-containing protein [Pectobacterium parmentieri]|uniref:Cyclic di-GMP regulator CdgR n=1 Tax=Pectobacterium parmentieri TaxID=1905730 RepID=A0A0H3I480_PECPM|nr:EAL domain-containing protein [Pectobacterium parmentieri]ACX88520.1 diguanylate phosphodiesterase [Pectobacterium parmentieri WPP163]AFI90833.1 Cyclic di-GMP regulator CdgR [Pectobacterium parmentieri]AOR58223.1 diguanylate phosphodiesterase [Pectobacterium parmentieri]AYH01946.1 diguanylate phosphodiesterase [Pectobacterium parmentieri]AYH10764.1 diguanylate phosphodiesterase [Pectobacterium parmentieri]